MDDCSIFIHCYIVNFLLKRLHFLQGLFFMNSLVFYLQLRHISELLLFYFIYRTYILISVVNFIGKNFGFFFQLSSLSCSFFIHEFLKFFFLLLFSLFHFNSNFVFLILFLLFLFSFLGLFCVFYLFLPLEEPIEQTKT